MGRECRHLTTVKRINISMSDELKAAIDASGESLREISRGTGIAVMSLSRFKRGERSMRLDKADKLAEYFGLELKERK